MKRAHEIATEVMQALSITLLAEGVTVALAIFTAFVWIAIHGTRPA